MPSSAGLLTPRGPFSGAAPLALRPLSAIAATSAGGVPESRIKRIVSDLIPSLAALHAQAEICGGVSLDMVGMDENAHAHLMPEVEDPLSQRSNAVPASGFAPFELYTTDSAEWPRGPWTDIYALCAVMHSLVTGARPAPAPERRAVDPYEPLAVVGPPKYSQEFLAVIDAGLAMHPEDRPQTLEQLAHLLGISAQLEEAAPAANDEAAGTAVAACAAPAEAVRGARRGSRLPLLALLLAVALGGAALYAWFQFNLGTSHSVIRSSEVVPPSAGLSTASGTAETPPASAPEPVPVPAPDGAQPPAAPTETPSAAQAEGPGVPASPPEQAAPPPTVEAPPAADEAPKAKPVPVRVRLDIRPWGEVWVNGIAKGISPPVKEIRLIPGKYQVVLRNADLPPYRATLEIKPGQPAVISHTFQ